MNTRSLINYVQIYAILHLYKFAVTEITFKVTEGHHSSVKVVFNISHGVNSVSISDCFRDNIAR